MFAIHRRMICCLCLYNILALWWWLQCVAETFRSVKNNSVKQLEIKNLCVDFHTRSLFSPEHLSLIPYTTKRLISFFRMNLKNTRTSTFSRILSFHLPILGSEQEHKCAITSHCLANLSSVTYLARIATKIFSNDDVENNEKFKLFSIHVGGFWDKQDTVRRNR
jgi:hypothetical protein